MQGIRAQLRIIFTLILNLETLQEALYTAARRELEAQLQYEKKCESSSNFGINTEIEKEHKTRALKFKHFVSTIKCQVKQLSNKYNEFITRFLKALSTSSDMNLQLLSVRLNFNDFYQVTWHDSKDGVSADTKPVGVAEKLFPSNQPNYTTARCASERTLNSTNRSNDMDLMYSFTDNISINSSMSTNTYGSINQLLLNKHDGKRRKNIWCCIGWGICFIFIYVSGKPYEN